MQALKDWWESLFGPRAILAEPGFDPTIDPLPSALFGNRRGSQNLPWLRILIYLGLAGVFVVGMGRYLFPQKAEAKTGSTATASATASETATSSPTPTLPPTSTPIPSVTPYATDFGGFDTQPAVAVTVIRLTAEPYPTDPTSTPIIIYRNGGPGAPLPTYTPYPPQHPLPTYTLPPPQQPLPTYTPLATYTPPEPLPTYTPYPTYTPLAPLPDPTAAPYALYLPLVSGR